MSISKCFFFTNIVILISACLLSSNWYIFCLSFLAIKISVFGQMCLYPCVCILYNYNKLEIPILRSLLVNSYLPHLLEWPDSQQICSTQFTCVCVCVCLHVRANFRNYCKRFIKYFNFTTQSIPQPTTQTQLGLLHRSHGQSVVATNYGSLNLPNSTSVIHIRTSRYRPERPPFCKPWLSSVRPLLTSCFRPRSPSSSFGGASLETLSL